MGDETQVSACADDLFYILSHHVSLIASAFLYFFDFGFIRLGGD